MPVDTSCLFSTVRNSSGGRKKFGFLPPHGRELDADEEMTIFGNVLEAVANANGDRATSRRHMIAFEAAIERGDIEILATPAPIFTDATTGANKMMRLNNGTLGTLDPCWTRESSIDLVP
jgi:hypothetical protein